MWEYFQVIEQIGVIVEYTPIHVKNITKLVDFMK